MNPITNHTNIPAGNEMTVFDTKNLISSIIGGQAIEYYLISKEFKGDDVMQKIALLQDIFYILPDLSVKDLLEYYPDDIVNCVLILTTKDGFTVEQHLTEISLNKYTKAVTIKTLEHNLENHRTSFTDSSQLEIIREMHKALRFLQNTKN